MTTDKRGGFVAAVDSGVGGLSVIPALVKELPREDLVYFGDAANAPYGERTADEVREIVDGVVGGLIADGAKAVVLACNTATSAAAEYLRKKYASVPIVGMEPALKPASEAGDHPRVLVMATPLTIREKKLRDLAQRLGGRADFIFIPCHGLVELAESGVTDGDAVRGLIGEILRPYLDGADSIVLGCTHYAHMKNAIRAVAGDRIRIFDGAEGTARETRRRLAEAGLLKEDGDGTVTIRHSSRDPGYGDICRALLSRL